MRKSEFDDKLDEIAVQYDNDIQEARTEAYEEGYETGFEEGEQQGFIEGYEEGRKEVNPS